MIEYMLQSPGNVVEAEKEIQEPKNKDVLVKVKTVGVCGSDIHLYHGTYNAPHSYPMLFGHEWSGVVEKIGENVTKVKVGDIVTGDCSKYCGVCENCQKDLNLCGHIEKFGITIDGASAEYIIRDEMYLYTAPKDTDVKLVGLSEPIAVAAHLIQKINKVSDGELKEKNILVMGGGVIGMSAMLLLKNIYNCDNVFLYDLSEYRKKTAEKLGAIIPDDKDLEVNTDEKDYSSLYSAAKYDVIIETTGVPRVFDNSISLLKPMGILGSVGMALKVEFAQKQIVTKSLTIVGSIGGSGDFGTAIRLIEEYPEKVQCLISHYFPISEVKEAFETASDAEKSMKVVLTV